MKYYVVDSFTDKIFSGNPAGVCLLENNIDEKIMQKIAAENNLAETAFVLRGGDNFNLHWFTPEFEIDLCGHATLASAFIISNFLDKNRKEMRFNTKSGELIVIKKDDLYEMDFPAWELKPVETTQLMKNAINAEILESHLSRDLLLLVNSEEDIIKITPDIDLLKNIPDCLGVIVTAKGGTVDFVSRFFAPNAGIAEDHVTGSTHSELIPFWSKRLDKQIMTARQLSKRGGDLYCEDCGKRVKIAGKAVLYMTGEIIL
ncbi:MAG: PhzF family phenazine biosynthesis protein [Oscillospiraceae bacterium]|nr:PhzF family phenazine biosynthesis protein [Oscillospiraceae bacterium]